MTQAEGAQRSVLLRGQVSRFPRDHTTAWDTQVSSPGPLAAQPAPLSGNNKRVGFSAGPLGSPGGG